MRPKIVWVSFEEKEGLGLVPRDKGELLEGALAKTWFVAGEPKQSREGLCFKIKYPVNYSDLGFDLCCCCLVAKSHPTLL